MPFKILRYIKIDDNNRDHYAKRVFSKYLMKMNEGNKMIN